MEIVLLVIIPAVVAIMVYMFSRLNRKRAEQHPAEPVSYPYRPDVEQRTPEGRITTCGYAAVHPEQFTHWMNGPEDVMGENIDRHDWEEWRVNYWGM